MLPVKIPPFAFYSYIHRVFTRSLPLPLSLSPILSLAISACLIHNLRHNGATQCHLCTQVRSQRTVSPTLFHLQTLLSPFCPRLCPLVTLSSRVQCWAESCSFNFHEIIICFVIRASLAGRAGPGGQMQTKPNQTELNQSRPAAVASI